MKLTAQDMWAGTEDSLDAFVEIQAKIDAKGFEMPEKEGPALLQISNGVGIVSVRGPISNTDSPWNSMFGMTSYPAISEAMVTAAQDPSVRSIMLDIDSPGGSVAGIAEASELISTINKRVKPVMAYAAGGALSAAYWLASSAGKIMASKTSMVGSVGVITTHSERSEALKADGINVTVIRAGKYKALASPHETLTEAAREQIQSSLDGAYAVFAGHVAEARGLSMPIFEATAGQGRVFFGAAAQPVGLIDGVMGFSEALQTINRQSLDKSKMSAENQLKIEGVNPMTGKTTLTEADIAAIAAGAGVALPAVTAPVAEAEVEIDASSVQDPVVDGADAPAPAAAAALPAADTALMAHLKSELLASGEALVDAKVELKGLKAQITQMVEAHKPALDIVCKSIANMQVALGASPVSLDGRAISEVIAEHSRLSDAFSSKFKVGGVAATSSAESLIVATPQSDALHQARIAATQSNRKGAK